MKISIEAEIEASIKDVWNAWVTPEDITRWNFANDEWCCPSAESNFEVGGQFNYRMEAKDGSMGFDFKGSFTEISLLNASQTMLEDEREVRIEFSKSEKGTKIVESFDVEDENSAEQQRQGWLAILNNFKNHVENKGS